MGLLFLLVVLISFNFSEAARELGQPAMLKRTLHKASSDSKEHICHQLQIKEDNGIELGNQKNVDSFDATLDCLYQCQGEIEKKLSLKKSFHPRDLSLSPGDGSSSQKILWRSLGYTLQIWSQETCLAKAIELCQGASKVESLDVKKIKSGTWDWNGELNCKMKQTIYSPFDDEFKLEGNQSHSQKMSLWGKDLSPINKMTEFISQDSSVDKIWERFNQNDCKKKIKVHTCFGDCIWESSAKKNKWSETISTKDPLGNDDFTLCGDSFLKAISDKGYSTRTKILKCQKYVWEVLRKTEPIGSSCAALRVEANCESLFN